MILIGTRKIYIVLNSTKLMNSKIKIIHNIIKGVSISDLERAYDKIHAWFFAYPTKEFSLNDLVENLGMSKTTAGIVVSQLYREGFLKAERLGKIWRIKANLDHKYFKTRKI